MSNKEKAWKQQEDLAESVIRGELERLEDIVEVPAQSFFLHRLKRFSWRCTGKEDGTSYLGTSMPTTP